MGKRTARQKALRALRRIAAKRELGYCPQCDKFLWPTRETANIRVEELKAKAGVNKPYLLGSYPCPHGTGFHVGHNYKLGLPISICIGEHK